MEDLVKRGVRKTGLSVVFFFSLRRLDVVCKNVIFVDWSRKEECECQIFLDIFILVLYA